VESREDTRTNIESYRSRSSSIGFFFLCFIFLGMIVESLYSGGLRNITMTTCWSSALVVVFHAIMHKPKVIVFDQGIEIINPLSRHTIPWSDVRLIDTRFSLAILTHNGDRIHAWAAPAPGRYHSRRLHSSDLRGLDMAKGGHIKAGESPKSESGAAYLLVAQRFEEFKTGKIVTGAIAYREFTRQWSAIAVVMIAIALLIAL